MKNELDPFFKIRTLVDKKGQEKDVAKFHRSVNEIFHNVEANFYDKRHVNMWESLPPIFELISNKIKEAGIIPDGKKWNLLDIGSGTGLSTELFLKTNLGQYISEVTLLDSSFGMIQKSKERSKKWENVKVNFINGYIDQVDEKYNIIICSSLLHHIPDLKQFFLHISRLQEFGDVFVHLQDPNSFSLNSEIYRIRKEKFEKFRKENKIASNLSLMNFIRSVKKSLKSRLFGSEFINEVNKQLIINKIIYKKLTAAELWSITDIHVENLPYSIGEGVSIDMIGKDLISYSNLLCFTYSFFGRLSFELPDYLKMEEQELLKNKDMNGRNLAGIWLKDH